jgi:hypothetical protein
MQSKSETHLPGHQQLPGQPDVAVAAERAFMAMEADGYVFDFRGWIHW